MIGIVILIFVLMGFTPDIYYLQLPLIILMSFIFFTAWSLFSSPLAAISKDFSNLVKSFITAVFWLSGVIWDPSGVSNKWAQLFLKINPITYLTQSFRNTFIYKEWIWESPKELLVFAGVTLIMILLATWSYNRLRKEIPDVL
jgi:ABC-type polysaccharide/polyol phosphate export permease